MTRSLFFLFLMASPLLIIAQEQRDTIPEDYRVFYYPDGQVSSEGFMVDGKPDGHWKNYWENGNLKSEGNRKNFLLDGPWKFYDQQGELRLVINYRDGVKHGYRITYTPDERIEELFENDIKQGNTYHYDADGFLTRVTPFENGRENGYVKYFDRDSLVTILMEYRRGVAISREFINRYDHENNPHGPWKTFYSSGIIKEEYTYKHGVLDGYYKKYDREGNLESIVKYEMGNLIVDSDEIFEYEIRRNYYPNMQVKIVGTYRDGVADGVRKEYNPDGSLAIAYIFEMGSLLGSGILDEQGLKQGSWKEFYREGGLKAEGSYKDGVKIGAWTFYFPNGRVEQTGSYTDRGREQGKWTWYYFDGTLRREENFTNGQKNGDMIEYDEDGNVIARGTFVDDEEDGPWYYQEEGYTQEGEYVLGEREGEWKHHYPEGNLSFKGKFIDGYPDGKHVFYNPNGSVKREGNYIVGVRHGVWRFYDDEGNLVLIVEYRNGIEIKYDNILIKPEITGSDL